MDSTFDEERGERVAGVGAGARPRPWDRAIALWPLGLDVTLFGLTLALFLFSRLYRLEDWPIYFFTDEAIQTVLARQFIEDGFRDARGRLLPTYFENGPYFNLSVSVYVQVITYKLFGFSAFWTRATSSLIALAGTAAVALILRDVFKLRFWWIGAMFLAITPAWFLHSRTAFETVIAVSFYAWGLYCYLRYRTGTPLLLLPAVLLVALAFYSYSASQLTVVGTAALLALSDLRYHWQHRRVVAAAVVLAALCTLPYVRFRLQQPDEVYLHLRTLNSYWINDDLSTMDKIREFWSEYRQGLSLRYWYARDNVPDVIRHQMRGWGFLWWPTFPFTALGLAVCLKNVRSSQHRALILALLAAPLGGAMVAIGITRVLILVVPAALLASIGAETLLRPLAGRVRYAAVALAAFAVLGGVQMMMLRSALDDGPTWYTDYGLYGMQYGAIQIADGARETWKEDPDARVLISTSWTNGGEAVFYFLLDGDQRHALSGVESYRQGQLPLTPNLVFVLTADEYERARDDLSFEDVQVLRTLEAPDGTNAFYFVRLSLSPLAQVVTELERQDSLRPITETIELEGERVSVRRSQLDIGKIEDVFDNDEFTLIRTRAGNPVRFDFTYPSPRDLSGLRMLLGSHGIDLDVDLYTADGKRATTYAASYDNPSTNLDVDLPFPDAPAGISRVVITIKEKRPGDDIHIHLHEMDIIRR